jgi:glycosyltransferase involved in cell wall biosynthesis
MKVLIPLHSFLPVSRYGAELYTYYLARELQACGMGVHLLFAEQGTAGVHERRYDGLECTVVGRAVKLGPAGLDRSNEMAERCFVRLLRQFRPDVVHFNHLLHLSTGLPRLAKEYRCRVVFTLHDYWMRCPKVKLLDWWGERCVAATAWKCASCCRGRFSRMTWPTLKLAEKGRPGKLKRLLKEICFQVAERPLAWFRVRQRQREMRRLTREVDRFIAPTRFLGARMAEWGICPDQIVCCDYGTMELDYAPRGHAALHRRLRLGFLGGPTREKGLHVLLEAFRGLDGADLVIYGAGLDDLRREYAAVLDQPNVVLGGRIDDAQKAVLLPQLDALVVPSVWFENSPLVIHEAFQAGVPVICSDVGGMAELVTDGVDGLHFQAGNPEDLRALLSRCIQQPDTLERLRGGVRKPKGMSEHVRTEIIPLYESLCRQTLPGVAGAHP